MSCTPSGRRSVPVGRHFPPDPFPQHLLGKDLTYSTPNPHVFRESGPVCGPVERRRKTNSNGVSSTGTPPNWTHPKVLGLWRERDGGRQTSSGNTVVVMDGSFYDLRPAPGSGPLDKKDKGRLKGRRARSRSAHVSTHSLGTSATRRTGPLVPDQSMHPTPTPPRPCDRPSTPAHTTERTQTGLDRI